MNRYNYGIQFPPKTMGRSFSHHRRMSCGCVVQASCKGLVATSSEERSQTMNKVMALRKLRALLAFNEWNGVTSGDVGIVKDWTPESLEERTSRYEERI